MHSGRWLETLLSAGAPPDGAWVLLEGGSMEPAYADGDWLLVEPLARSRPIGPGDVVVARRGRRLVTHRILDLRDGVVVTKGDACMHADPPIAASDLLGRVTGVRRAPGLLRRLRRMARRMTSI